MSNIVCPKPSANVAPPIIDGNENINPKNETRPEAIATKDNAIILPITNSLFLIGVIRTEASVPLSFSPEIDSGQNEMTVEYNNETVTIGKTNAKML